MLLEKVNFNVNAEKYSQWNVTTNGEYLDKFYDFSGITENDKVIDIACGSGDFLLNCANRIGESKGIDSSEKLIEIACSHLKEKKVTNVSFETGDIEKISNFGNGKYNAIICRMAIHHFNNPQLAFMNCMKYADTKCIISMQDIISHEIEFVDQYFDKLERLIDRTHKRIISRRALEILFSENNICIEKSIVLEREIILSEYIKHANQATEQILEIEKALLEGINNDVIGKFIYKKNNEIVFKRRILLIKGRLGKEKI